MIKHGRSVAAAWLCVTLLAGCASQPTQPKLYAWGNYQGSVHDYLRADKVSPETQLQQMEADLARIRAAGGSVPPGFYAHLGLLYGKLGKADQFALQIAAEKKQFPESETFMDFLTRNFKK